MPLGPSAAKRCSFQSQSEYMEGSSQPAGMLGTNHNTNLPSSLCRPLLYFSFTTNFPFTCIITSASTIQHSSRKKLYKKQGYPEIQNTHLIHIWCSAPSIHNESMLSSRYYDTVAYPRRDIAIHVPGPRSIAFHPRSHCDHDVGGFTART